MQECFSTRSVDRHELLQRFFPRVTCFSLITLRLVCDVMYSSALEDYASGLVSYRVVMNLTYHDPVTDEFRSESEEVGKYSVSSRKDAESGLVLHTRMTDWQGCMVSPMAVPIERWIALVDRGSCKFVNTKIPNSTALRNASAIVFYSSDGDYELDSLARAGQRDESIYVFIPKSKGERIASLVDNGTRVHMQISLSSSQVQNTSSMNRTSMLFLAISFIILMIISMAWLVFYYVQRSRYTYAKQRLSRRLMSAAKKAISKMPLKTVRGSEDRTDPGFDLCAICIEGYKSSDVVRILPCKHIFHKHCIDPWLMEQRNCPICKTDILKSFGLQVRQESTVNVDTELGSASFGYSEFGPMDSVRDFDSDGVEIVHFQLAHIEHHVPCPAMTTSSTCGGGSGATPQRPRCSRDSSDDCDATDASSDADLRGWLLMFDDSPGNTRAAATAADVARNIPIDASVVTRGGSVSQAAGDRVSAIAINHRASVHRSSSMAPNETMSPVYSDASSSESAPSEAQSLMVNRFGSLSDVGS